METTLHVNDYKLHKPGKWGNNKNWLKNWFVATKMTGELPLAVLLLRLNW